MEWTQKTAVENQRYEEKIEREPTANRSQPVSRLLFFGKNVSSKLSFEINIYQLP